MLAGRCIKMFFKCKYGLFGALSHSAALTLIPFRRILSSRGDQYGHQPFRSLLYQKKCGTLVLQCVNHRMIDRWCSSLAPDDHLSVDHSDSPATEHAHKSPTCSGCGTILQCTNVHMQGYIPREKLEGVDGPSLASKNIAENVLDDGAEDEEEVCERSDSTQKNNQLTCKRCFSLKHYNTALNVTLQADDYLHHLSHLGDKRALILLVVDVIDFPGSLFPSLHILISPTSRVLVVANKADLLPKDTNRNSLEGSLLDECEHSGLSSSALSGVIFTSVRTGEGLECLANAVVEKWGNRGDVYLLGCTNVGKSSLFNHLLLSLCGARPGELDEDCGVGAPAATISHWPGTTLGLLSFPIMSVGKRRRLLAQQLRVEEMELRGREGERRLCTPVFPSRQEVRVVPHPPQNRFWLHDTPGAINKAQVISCTTYSTLYIGLQWAFVLLQLINLLTTKELNLALPKKPLSPRTFILKPSQCLLLGGLARLDYLDVSCQNWLQAK